ncbi:MAG: flagellar biosynthesis anti-sigma factor FlgM [Armatimonadetes bacterium]|nr:flagellar biosynthesis anti-sigma factor FlgM [Armatimonadota bacterium]
MRISDIEVSKVREISREPQDQLTDVETPVYDPAQDRELVQQVTQSISEMGDREDMIASLKARIEAGEYNPSGDDIADTMIRRAIADRIR